MFCSKLACVPECCLAGWWRGPAGPGVRWGDLSWEGLLSTAALCGSILVFCDDHASLFAAALSATCKRLPLAASLTATRGRAGPARDACGWWQMPGMA